MGMVKNHAQVVFENGTVTLTANTNGRVFANGQPVKKPVELKHNMRVWLGNNYAFRFVFPGKEDEGEKFDEGEKPDYFFAEQEIAEACGGASEVAGAAGGVSPGISAKLSDALKKVDQANIIAVDLGQRVEFEAKIFKNRTTGENDVVIRANMGDGVELFWPMEKFNERLVIMSNEWASWQNCEESGQAYSLKDAVSNPFVDNDFQLVGECDVWLRSLANMIEHHADPCILAPSGKVEGRTQVSIVPCDSNHKEGPWEDNEENDPFVDDPNDLLDEEIAFKVKISNIVFDMGQERAHCKFHHTFVRYRIDPTDRDGENSEWNETEKCEECTYNPSLKYKKLHTMKVNPQRLNLLMNGRIILQVYGKMAADSKVDELPRSGKRGELMKLDADIAEQRKKIEELDAKIQECKKKLAPQERRGSRAAPLP